ncbi:hypothetical protein OG552_19960 [Streptomyces sp. NBC_01476]|uniref:hypothetical protein n=1 Tax=Streptomyces sp. NBC_01476 TaxID=2903881 RepID=UPI002E358F05|nr:hypothetical protein [Streptomyces sp. NBC_01476]
MTRSSLPIAVAFAASAGLLLTACGGGGSDSADKIQPSATTAAAPTTTSSTPTPTPPTGPDAPKFNLPPDLTVEFTGFDSAKAEDKLVLQDASYAAKSVLELEVQPRTKVTPNFSRFWTGERGASYADSLISQIKGGTVITGVYRYYNPVVKSVQGGAMQVTYCEDQRKAYSKDFTTGRVHVTSPSPSDFRQWTLLMSKSSSGEWQAFDHSWLKGAKQCAVS